MISDVQSTSGEWYAYLVVLLYHTGIRTVVRILWSTWYTVRASGTRLRSKSIETSKRYRWASRMQEARGKRQEVSKPLRTATTVHYQVRTYLVCTNRTPHTHRANQRPARTSKRPAARPYSYHSSFELTMPERHYSITPYCFVQQ